eukprot:CAMPEP_0173155752 /NCGR_PEP_ID=MMETSP1105-20130129/14307_1 /TAXON_ID=2985 /ORGANISM="Ochromonas sp., Strain BG-1" /LENGTH=690 /DNA_ID=CAMNT_0014072267 /DNA_START=11 /DNA_END=2083 /DNA_ORIENTATION=+
MTSRNKLKLQNVEDTPEEWIWGNHRGGGGAPLKDVYGNSVANLKPVLKGEAEMDYLSASPSKQKLPRNRQDYDDEPPRNSNKSGKQNNNHPRFREEEDDDYRGGARGRRASGGGREYHVHDDDYDQHAPRELRLPPKKPPKGGNNARRHEEDVGGSDIDYDSRGSLGPPKGGGVRRDSDNRRHNDYNEDSSHYSNQSSQRANHQSHNQPSSNYIPPNPHSPKKFMSALQELQGVTDREKQEKMKRAMEYQNQLKRQIEEKNRKKEMEKQQEEELKRREYREYMESISPRTRGGEGGFGGDAQKEKKKVPLFKQERECDRDYPPVHQTRSRDDDDHDPARRSSKPPPAKPGRSVSSHYDDDRDNYSVNDQRYRQDRGGLNQKSNNNKIYDSNYDSDPDSRRNGRGAGNSSLSPNPKTKVVSAQEYDELSKLCDKLLSQQETLQSEIRNQAHLIKELQKKGVVANVNTTNKPPNPLLRSKSVQQQRPGNQNNQNNKAPVSERGGGAGAVGGNDARSKSNMRPRPSSMYEGSKQLQINGRANNNNNNKPNQSKVEQKKASKAAFGNAVINDKMPAGGAHKAPSLAAGNQKKPTTNAVGAKDKVPNKGRDSEGGINGFAKLQAKVHNQPVIVTYEDEDVGASKSSLNLELRGQSRYVPVHESSIDEGDDYSYRGRGGGDQLDKLLANTKKGKFA